MAGILDSSASFFSRAVTRAKGDYRSGHRSKGYEQYLLEGGKFPRHVQGSAHVDRILADVQAFVELASGIDVQVILDIGALNGIESRVLAKTFPNARVFTFEPVPESIQEVRYITRDLSNVVVIESAVSDRNGSTSFFVTRNRGTSSLRRPLEAGPTRRMRFKEVRVPTTTIETWASEWGIKSIDLVWMDVQGAEDLVLRGFGQLLSDVKLLKTEMGISSYYEGHANARDVRPLLEGAGLSHVYTALETPWEVDVIYKRLNGK